MGVFFLENKHLDENLVRRMMTKGWKLHPICDFREIEYIVKENGYRKIFSPLPYNKQWGEIKLDKNVIFIGTFHGARDIETSQYALSEKGWYKGDNAGNGQFIYNKNEEIQKGKIEEYKISLQAFSNRRIITSSNYSKSVLLYYYPKLKAEEVEVLYCPHKNVVAFDEYEENVFLKKTGIKARKYGLMISAGIYYKNCLRGTLAFDKLFDEQRDLIPDDYKVVVLGLDDVKGILSRIKNKERFVFSDYVSTKELEILYKNAHVFVYPTLNEGFGYPPIEALKYQTICACSAGTSVSEICGDMVEYFNPFLINEIAAVLLKCFLGDVREKLTSKIEKGLPILIKRQKEDFDKLLDILTA